MLDVSIALYAIIIIDYSLFTFKYSARSHYNFIFRFNLAVLFRRLNVHLPKFFLLLWYEMQVFHTLMLYLLFMYSELHYNIFNHLLFWFEINLDPKYKNYFYDTNYKYKVI